METEVIFTGIADNYDFEEAEDCFTENMWYSRYFLPKEVEMLRSKLSKVFLDRKYSLCVCSTMTFEKGNWYPKLMHGDFASINGKDYLINPEIGHHYSFGSFEYDIRKAEHDKDIEMMLNLLSGATRCITFTDASTTPKMFKAILKNRTRKVFEDRQGNRISFKEIT